MQSSQRLLNCQHSLWSVKTRLFVIRADFSGNMILSINTDKTKNAYSELLTSLENSIIVQAVSASGGSVS